MKIGIGVQIWIVTLLLSSCNYAQYGNRTVTIFDSGFTKEMAMRSSFADVLNQVLIPKCIVCHGKAGGINLESYSEVLNNLEKIKRSSVDSDQMPKSPFPQLTGSEKNILRAWLSVGAPEFPKDGSVPPVLNPLEPIEPAYASIFTAILKKKCLSCHSPGGDAHRVPLLTKEDLLNSPLDIVIPGNAEESGLILATTPGARKPMPPVKSGVTPLTNNELSAIADWINNGAKD